MQAVSPPALLLFQDFLQETKYNFLHIVACHMVAAIVRQAGQVASHIAKTACWAHPNPCKMRKYPFAAARSSCAYSLRKEAQHPLSNVWPSLINSFFLLQVYTSWSALLYGGLKNVCRNTMPSSKTSTAP